MPEYIDMTPTDEGFANIAMTFADSILRDVKVARRADSAVLLDGLVEIVAYLARNDRSQLDRLRDYITKGA